MAFTTDSNRSRGRKRTIRSHRSLVSISKDQVHVFIQVLLLDEETKIGADTDLLCMHLY